MAVECYDTIRTGIKQQSLAFIDWALINNSVGGLISKKDRAPVAGDEYQVPYTFLRQNCAVWHVVWAV
jgi:hypothetical protein